MLSECGVDSGTHGASRMTVAEIRKQLPAWEGWYANLSEYKTWHSLDYVTSEDVRVLLDWVRLLLSELP